jgi:hypothetical protein
MKQTQTIPETLWFSSQPEALDPDKIHKKPQYMKRRSEFPTQ